MMVQDRTMKGAKGGDPTRPDLEERYAQAIEADDLMVRPSRGPVDMLVAAGWTKESLGTALYRLRTEFDAVRGDYRLVGRAPNVTDLLLILSALTTLRDTRDALGRFAVAFATRKRYMADDGTVLKIAGKALQYWLDPQCHECEGRGFTGGYGLPMELCKACGGTKKRQATHYHTAAGHEFAKALLCEMDRKTDHVTTMLRQFLAAGQQGKKPKRIDHQQQDLKARLVALRSTQAEAD